VGGVDRQVKAHPRLTVALEAFDIAGAERGGLGAGVQFGGDFQVDAGQLGVFVEALHSLLGGSAKAWDGQQAKQ